MGDELTAVERLVLVWFAARASKQKIEKEVLQPAGAPGDIVARLAEKGLLAAKLDRKGQPLKRGGGLGLTQLGKKLAQEATEAEPGKKSWTALRDGLIARSLGVRAARGLSGPALKVAALRHRFGVPFEPGAKLEAKDVNKALATAFGVEIKGRDDRALRIKLALDPGPAVRNDEQAAARIAELEKELAASRTELVQVKQELAEKSKALEAAQKEAAKREAEPKSRKPRKSETSEKSGDAPAAPTEKPASENPASEKPTEKLAAEKLGAEKLPATTELFPAATLELPDFARQVLEAARSAPSGRFGDDKVFVSHVWRRFQELHGNGLDLAAWKERLAEANRKGLLRLVRADLVQAMDERDVAESLVRHLTAEFHFVRI